jgi:hypothetical protein
MATNNNNDLWGTLNAMREDLAELKGMMKVHMDNDNIHHNPPCRYSADINKNILTAIGAAVLALLGALGALLMEFLKK